MPRNRRPGRDGDRVGLRGASRRCSAACCPATTAGPTATAAAAGADHLLPVFAGPSLTVPVQGGRLLLGTWQRICLVDLNDDNPRRRVRLSFLAG